MSLIVDNNEFEKFIDMLPTVKNDEAYFVSLSARNKYLTMEEREYYSLGLTEMFGREYACNKHSLVRCFKKLEATLSYKTTRNGKPIPEKSLVVYANINPSSMTKAYIQFEKEMSVQLGEIVVALQTGKQPNYDFINYSPRALMNCIQKSTGTKYFVDVDCDTKDEKVLRFIIDGFVSVGIVFKIIETQGGYHFLVEKKSIPPKFNFYKIITNARILTDKEVDINKNGMVPVPGTKQAEFLVKFLNIENISVPLS